MLNTVKELTYIQGTSGREEKVREYILNKISDKCSVTVDPLGNIICFKKGKKASIKKVMLDAHMDEVGFIITAIDSNGFLKFSTVGGIDVSVMLSRRVKLGSVTGVIGSKPVHLCSDADKKNLPKVEDLYIDIGATTKEQALEYVKIGDTAVFENEFLCLGDNIAAKALDDRIGCAVLINLLENYDEYDFYAVFSVQEEVGLRGARVATYTVNPDSAIVLEATTAQDIKDVPDEKQVCKLGCGTAVSFMDKSTVYDKAYYNAALNSGIQAQPKAAVAGGNNSGAVHLTRGGVRTVALSVPCRYIHSALCVCNKNDIDSTLNLAKYMLSGIASGEIK